MAHSIAALVDDVLAVSPNHQADCLRDEAITLALNLLLESDEITALLQALEARTGTRLERRTRLRPPRRRPASW